MLFRSRNRENENLRRLLRDVARLELQLENALVLAQSERGKLFPEEISLRKMLDSLRPHWPDLEIKLEQDASLVADQRALECVFRNLFQNALVHGHASSVLIRLKAMESGVLVQVIDNGKGFEGNLETLGAAFVRHTTRSGSGIGLYLSRILTTRMGGKISFSRNELRGLCVSIELKGWLE